MRNLDVFGEGEAVLEEIDGYTLVSNRKYPYSSYAVRLSEKGHFCTEIKIRAAEKCGFRAVNKIAYEYEGKEYVYYDSAEPKSVSADEWTTLKSEFVTPQNTKYVISYFLQTSGELCDVEVKDFNVTPAKNAEKPQQLKGFQPFTAGAIRWDAYFSTDSEKSTVSRQVARALSPEQYNYRAPYFAKKENGKITFPVPVQEQFDREAELAISAGIDYFAYCWYRDNDEMSYARKQHLRSKYRDRIKMCAIVHVTGFDEETYSSLAAAMKEDCYLKFENRPVVYVFGACSAGNLKDKITEYAVNAGCERPYFIGMNPENQPYMLDRLACFEAIGSYAFPAVGQGETYKSLAARCEKMNLLRLKSDSECVPVICLGHDFRPRIDNPVSWMGGKTYSLPPESGEIYSHALNTFKALKSNPQKPNTALIYAWNEHDEGGWICPTICNESHLEEIKDALGEVK